MRFRDAVRQHAQPPAPRPYIPGEVLEAGFIPAPGRANIREMARQLRDGPLPPEEGEIDPATGAEKCLGKDSCTLNVCSAGIYAHGVHPENLGDAGLPMATGPRDNLAMMSEREQAALLEQGARNLEAMYAPPPEPLAQIDSREVAEAIYSVATDAVRMERAKWELEQQEIAALNARLGALESR